MPSLHQKVKDGLDEARILVLGSQVLLGFQYRAFFEPGFERLAPGEVALALVGLFAMLVTVGGLFLAAARHRIVEGGYDTERFHRFTAVVMRSVLLPFAVALGCELALAGSRVAGRVGAVVAGGVALIAALALWYGYFLHPGRRRRHQDREDAVEQTPLDQRIVQVLTEARVVLPGAQALLGLQLAMVLMESFERLPWALKVAHLVSLGFVALTTIVLMAPAAYHRIVERGENSERFHSFASAMVLVALALLAPGLCGDLYVVLRKVGFARAALPVSLLLLALLYGSWFGAMLVVRRAGSRRPGARTPRRRVSD